MAAQEMEYQHDARTYAIIGAAIEVHKQLGPGFLEAVYQEALALELNTRSIPFTEQVELPVYYKDSRLNTKYRADFLCYGEVIVEIKSVSKLTEIEYAQVINYLKASRFATGLLLNFGAPSLQCKRLINDVPRDVILKSQKSV